jgi:hypothetical protein
MPFLYKTKKTYQHHMQTSKTAERKIKATDTLLYADTIELVTKQETFCITAFKKKRLV